MKFNWGHGIILVIVLAVAGFLSMVFITTRERIDMVTEDYYPKELKYDDQIEKIKNYNALSKKVEVTLGDALYIQFPDNIANASDISGLVHLYRPSDKDLDIEKDIQLNSSYGMSIPLTDLMNGKYELIIEWQANGQPYLTKEVVYVN
ncbi:FixH family protein [Carboxylicivirga mesophila]|uniref:FixH family protein n=1 Tax=Carboxylicivirga mesophila TaxID=1166478 RepID=A0ABS5KBF3_9BACT|nr:FixH family protein [Carboxylicivirga mesophila]MBS2212316.1 FixH family protein [Carboxylicivirga mesophila]